MWQILLSILSSPVALEILREFLEALKRKPLPQVSHVNPEEIQTVMKAAASEAVTKVVMNGGGLAPPPPAPAQQGQAGPARR